MTPGARIAAAILCLDSILAGAPAEQVLTRWARTARYAGSGDRAAVRDHVFSALRKRRSAAWVGGGETGRALMIGVLRLEDTDPATLFTGAGHAPAPLAAGEGGGVPDEAPLPVRADLPDWLWPRLVAENGEDGALRIGMVQRERATPWLRVNIARCTREEATEALARDGVETEPHPSVRTALAVTAGLRRLRNARAFLDGLVEPQDASSQEAVLHLPLRRDMRILDFCAGGGGKALAMAALTGGMVHAHDSDPARMTDIAPRAARAGADIRILSDPATEAPFDLVLVDAPCSGSGTWRRTPDAKWRLTEERLSDLLVLQGRIARKAAGHVAPGGCLAWMTCSVLEQENAAQMRSLVQEGGWRIERMHDWLPDLRGDGFHLSLLQQNHRM